MTAPRDPLLQPFGAAIVTPSPPEESLLTRADRVLAKLDAEIARLKAAGRPHSAERVRLERCELQDWILIEERKRGQA